MSAHAHWGGRIGVILAVIGCAVGLGNFLKFPGLMATWGGGFLIPYAVALVLIGLPLCWVEWTMGRAGGAVGRHSMPGIMLALTGRRWLAVLSGIGPAIPLIIYSYYIVIEGWCLYYALRYAAGGLGVSDAAGFNSVFNAVTGINADGSLPIDMIVCVLLCSALNAVVLLGGIRAGIERVCLWAMPLLAIIAIIIIIRVLSLGSVVGADGVERSVSDGLGAVWNPERTVTTIDNGVATTRTTGLLDTITNPKAWLAAAGQIFFTLSVGMGVLITYASYMRRNDDVALSAATAAAGNEFCEVVLGGLLSVPAAVLFVGASILVAVPGIFSLGFVALPNVFTHMPAGAFFGFLFFFLLFLAALTSSISMLQPAVALFEEGFAMGHRRAVGLALAFTVPGMLLAMWLSKGASAIDTLDFWAGNLGVMLCALLMLISFAWLWGLRTGMQELQRSAAMPIPRVLGPIIAVVAPLLVAAILYFYLQDELKGGGRLAALAEWRVLLPAGYALLLCALCAVLSWRALPRLTTTSLAKEAP